MNRYLVNSLRSNYLRGVWEQNKIEERDFRCFARAKNGARDKKFLCLAHHFSRGQNTQNLVPRPFFAETLATQAIQWISVGKTNYTICWLVIYLVDIAIHPLNNWGQGSVVRQLYNAIRLINPYPVDKC